MQQGKLKSMITNLEKDVLEFTALKGMMLTFTGNGAANPTIVTEYNIASLTRTGVGAYRATLKQGTIYGIDISSIAVLTHGSSIVASAGSDFFSVDGKFATPSDFDITVNEVIQGAGTRLTKQPYDVIASDTVSFSLLVNAGGGELLPK